MTCWFRHRWDPWFEMVEDGTRLEVAICRICGSVKRRVLGFASR